MKSNTAHAPVGVTILLSSFGLLAQETAAQRHAMATNQLKEIIISGQKDTIFPPDGYHEVFQRTKRVYDLYAGANSERIIREVDDNVGHSDPPLFLHEARQWMQRWLKGDPTPLREETSSPPKENAEDLTCRAKLPADAINYKVQNQFTTSVTLKNPASRAAWATRRAELLAQLKAKVFRWFPTGKIPFETKSFTSNGGYMPKYADYKEVSFQSEDGVRIRGQYPACDRHSRSGGRPRAAPAGFVDQAARDVRFHTAHLSTRARLQPFPSVRELAGGARDLERTGANPAE